MQSSRCDVGACAGSTTLTERQQSLHQNRLAAATGYQLALSDRTVGVTHFRSNAAGSYAGNRNTKRQMDRWGKRLESGGDLGDANHMRTGRPRIVPDSEVLECTIELVRGYTVEVEGIDIRRGFTSLAAAALSGKAPKIKGVIEQYGISVKGLYRRMLSVMPELPNYKAKVDIKQKLTEKVKEARMKAAGKLRRLPLKKLKTVVWMDAKKMHIYPKALKVYTLDPDEVCEDERLPQGKFNNGFVLNFYSAVNALVGLVKIVWVTGTTGVDHGSKTMVWAFFCRMVMAAAAQLQSIGTLHLACRHTRRY
jgi:hypothetical protein